MNVKMILAALASVLALGAEAKDIYLLLGQSNMAGRGDLTQYNRLSTKASRSSTRRTGGSPRPSRSTTTSRLRARA